MAANWIKVEVITPDKPEIFRLSEILSIDPDAVLGKVIRFWVWADQQTINGNADNVTDNEECNADNVTYCEQVKRKCNSVSLTKSAIDRICFMHGFSDALIQVGWLAEVDGVLILPNFGRHNGESSKKRALTNKRVSKSRKLNQKSNAHNVTDNKKCNADNVTSSVTKTLPEEEEDIKDKRKREHIARDQPVDNFPENPPTDDPPDKFRMHPDWKPLPGFSERAEVWGYPLDRSNPFTPAQLRQFRDYWLPEETLRFQDQWEMTFARSLEHQAIKKFNET